MRKYSFSYFISQSFKGLWRNGVMSVASILVLMSCLIVMGSFALLVVNIDYNLESIGTLNKISVICDADCTDEEIAEIGRQIRLLENVDEDSVVHNTKEQILEEERAKYMESETDENGEDESFDEVFKEMIERGVNPYRDEYIITYKDNGKVATLEYQLGQIEGVAKINSHENAAETMEGVKNTIIFIFTGFLVILFVVSLFVIINTIKLAVYARREEIVIMRYVGATKWFITLPFVFEGVLIGLIASGLAYLIEWYAYSYVTKIISQESMITMIPFAQVNGSVAIAFLAVGVFAGIVGSVISLSKYLKA